MSGTWMGMSWFLVTVMAVAWLLAIAATPALLRRVARPASRPQSRKRALLLTALLPWLAPLLVASAVLAPAVAKPLGVMAHHCVEHGAGHPHICLAHPPAVQLSAWHWLPLAVAASWLLWNAAAHIARRRRARSQLRSILSFARGPGPLQTLHTSHCVALAADPGGPVILLSSELRKRLLPRQRRIVLAHEAAHLRHGDLPWSRWIDALLVLHIGPVARQLRAAWRQAIEEHADDAVATRFGREAVAEALIEVARRPAVIAGSVLGATGGNTALRISRLLDEPAEARDAVTFPAIYAGALLWSWVALVSAHHALETLLGFAG